MKNFKKLLKVTKPIIGMIHTKASPGTPNYKGTVKNIIDKAVQEALLYRDAGIDSIIIENMHDVPYINKSVGHEVSTLLSIIAYEIKKQTELPIGIQILAGANKQAIAAANSAGIDFIRAEGFVFGHLADEGMFESDAGELLRYRKLIDAKEIQIFTDIKKKHSSHSISSDISIEETAEAAEFFLSDGVILTGNKTGEEAELDEIRRVKESIKLPILVGSGISEQNIEKYFPFADAFIVGSFFKKNGKWQNGVDSAKVKSFMAKVIKLR